ncbi:hypothetical protein AAFC00_000483 [Neodothiora populina]|uniref:ER lumen protein retaining receptor n=1 Tax=Neodothiora populina TaxID=2781224 RepID=A0ABR3PD16_9PEZI
MIHFNIFRILGDVSHTVSKCILIWSIHSNTSAEGVSLITQILYILVFCSRYLDLLWSAPFHSFESFWNFTLKIFYITSSAYIVFLMLRVFARTREREQAWRLGAYSLGGSVLAAPIAVAIFEGAWGLKHPFESLYTFSLSLESTAILPQLLLLRQTSVPTVLDSFYLATLGSYRFFYLLNWIVRAATTKHITTVDPIFPISVLFGIVQTLLYVDFAWVYWTRQRVKLRYGGVVDGEDLGRGWLVGRLLGRGRGARDAAVDEEDERFIGQEEGIVRPSGPPRQQSNSWGPRGISVSADEGVLDAEDGSAGKSMHGLTDPAAFEDDEAENDAVIVSPQRLHRDDQMPSDDSDDEDDMAGRSGVYGGGAEWREQDEAYSDFNTAGRSG